MGTADNDVCIVGFARTPLGAYGGSLASLDALALGAHAIKCEFAPLRHEASGAKRVVFLTCVSLAWLSLVCCGCVFSGC